MKIKRALISVYDKTGIEEFAKFLSKNGVELVSTGQTAKFLREKGLNVTDVSEYTGAPEILDGRVKTLHPKVHGGLLARRGLESHIKQMADNGILPIDLLVVNLYPFEATIARPGCSFEDAVENIDIGGPTMLRAAAKNHESVAVLVEPADYEKILKELSENDLALSKETKFALAKKVFTTTARYDAAVARYLTSLDDSHQKKEMPEFFGIALSKTLDLRYGENPHQKAAFYMNDSIAETCPNIAAARQLQGKELSYNNILDADGALCMALDLNCYPFAVAIVKHSNPCGAAFSNVSLADALKKAIACDPVSAFGGIVAVTKPVDEECAMVLAESFYEVIVAPSFDKGALGVLSSKKNLRLLDVAGDFSKGLTAGYTFRGVGGGVLVQTRDDSVEDVSKGTVVTKRHPTEDEISALQFGWRVCKNVKSNAILFTSKDRTLGVGAGQMSRVDSVRIAVSKALSPLKGSCVASDAFFPFRDGLDEAAKAGATAVVQPGGSKRDDEVIKAADENGMAMIFTGYRHFRH